ncbi:FGGY-family carbohydrate kinase [Brucella intermedia]|uniref:FGGY-family carbohydrate kinase n=1 Tax=Brucella intermedia TaxID=94625 RepID=UPI00224AE7DD|nr:FGGY-family carbohydrate kinase [Brucella intermedia]
MCHHFVGIDVGTGSVRAGVFDETGNLLSVAKKDIKTWREDGSIVEQSSRDIWDAVCDCVRRSVQQAGVSVETVKGIGFDATCSLVVLNASGDPIAVGPSEDLERNIIVWMDHRAVEQANRINAGGHEVLQYVGGTISPEMETPKILWLKENRPEIFAAARHFFDLADFLSWRATGCEARSACTVTCKWTYLAHERRWDARYFEAIGLSELIENDFARIGSVVQDIGTALGDGLSVAAAGELGLLAGTPVGASLIDAHCGGVGTFSNRAPDGSAIDPERQMALIMGTSACAMTLAREPSFVEGVWGPYYGAMVPGYWLLEGGQSAYGAALDHLLMLHPSYPATKARADAEGLSLPAYLERLALSKAGSLENAAFLARDIHVVPEFLGNRAPFADPEAKAILDGLTIDKGESSLVQLYVAGLCGLCYGTRQIIEAEKLKGLPLELIIVSGGAAQSPLLRQLLCDATGLKVALPATAEPVLLGGAIIGSVASGHFKGIAEAADEMSRIKEINEPMGGKISRLHDIKFEAFCLLQEADRRVRHLTKTI